MRSQDDHCVYNKKVCDHFIYVVLSIDDTLLVENNVDLIKEVKQQLSTKFNMKDLNATHLILVMEIKRVGKLENSG